MFHNTTGELSALPVVIRGYYEEDIREDDTYIVLKPFGETQDNVVLVMERNKPIELVEKFLGFANNAIDKQFHDDYITWLGYKPSVEPVRARDKEGQYIPDDELTDINEAYENGYTPELYNLDMSIWQSQEPVKPPYKTLDDYPEYVKYRKLKGVEFEGVMCSATKEDMWGLSSIESFVRNGDAARFEFVGGGVLDITPDNIDDFYAVWMPFRSSFFS